jgi:hypothetical protein
MSHESAIISSPPIIMSMEVRIPRGLNPGDSLNVQASDGKIYSIIIPAGVRAGDLLRVDIQQPMVGSSGSNIVPTASATPDHERTAVGAAAVGGVVGTLLIGPVLGLVVAGAALYATTREGDVGDAARAAGSTAALTFDKASKKHHLGDRIKAASDATIKKAKELDEEYKIVDNVKSAASDAYVEAVKINEKYDITGTAARSITMGAKSIARLLGGDGRSSTSASTASTTSAPAINSASNQNV